MKNLSVVLINYVSTGKTAMARQLLLPHLPDCAEIITIETINKSVGQENALKADDFRKAMQLVDIHQADDKSIIVDVGVSNAELFLEKMKGEKAFDDFDYFLVVVTPDDKALENTIKCVECLSNEHAVPAKKIIMVFNKAPIGVCVEESFKPIFNYHSDMKKFTLKPSAVVHESPVFDMVKHGSLLNVSQDETDLKAAMRTATTIEEKVTISNARALRKMSVEAVAELNAVFKTLFVGK